MAEIKQHPPSERKLEQLRRSGVTVPGRDAATAGLVLGFVLSLTLVLPNEAVRLSKLVSFSFAEASTTEISLDFWQNIVLTLTRSFFFLVLPPLSLVFVIGLLRTRFLFQIGLSFPDLGRLSFAEGTSRFFTSLYSSITRLLLGLFWLALAAFIMFQLLPKAALSSEALLGERAQDYVAWFRDMPGINGLRAASVSNYMELSFKKAEDVVRVFFYLSLAFSISMGLLGYGISRQSYFRRHSMTTSELDQEYRETELSPELKRSMFERSQE